MSIEVRPVPASQESDPVLRVVRLSSPAEWHAYLIPLGELPLKKEMRPLLRNAMQNLMKSLMRDGEQRSVWLLLDELHREENIRLISEHAARWRPDMGLGLQPEAGPPRYWSESDLMDRDYGSPVPALMHSVMLLDTDEAGQRHACDMLAGMAALVQVVHNEPTLDMAAEWYDIFQPTILERGLAAYPLYLPLLGTSSIQSDNGAELARWMGRASVYVRESFEDKGIFILSRFRLPAALDQSGFLLEREQSEQQKLDSDVVLPRLGE